jgi:hypothetical protein
MSRDSFPLSATEFGFQERTGRVDGRAQFRALHAHEAHLRQQCHCAEHAAEGDRTAQGLCGIALEIVLGIAWNAVGAKLHRRAHLAVEQRADMPTRHFIKRVAAFKPHPRQVGKRQSRLAGAEAGERCGEVALAAGMFDGYAGAGIGQNVRLPVAQEKAGQGEQDVAGLPVFNPASKRELDGLTDVACEADFKPCRALVRKTVSGHLPRPRCHRIGDVGFLKVETAAKAQSGFGEGGWTPRRILEDIRCAATTEGVIYG